MRGLDDSLAERLGVAIADAILFLPVTAIAGWRYGREQLADAGLVGQKSEQGNS